MTKIIRFIYVCSPTGLLHKKYDDQEACKCGIRPDKSWRWQRYMTYWGARDIGLCKRCDQ